MRLLVRAAELSCWWAWGFGHPKAELARACAGVRSKEDVYVKSDLNSMSEAIFACSSSPSTYHAQAGRPVLSYVGVLSLG